MSALSYSPQYADREEKIKISWKSKKIPISISDSFINSAPNIKNKTDILAVVTKSLKKWESVANIVFEIKYTESENVSKKSSSGDGVSLITIAQTSENLLLFDDKLNEASAITRLFYNTKGEIIEADIVLNPIQLFSTDGTFQSFDLEATLTHEIGHFLGLGHSNVLGATMHSHQAKNGIYNLPGFSSRTLAEDDKAGIISLYGSKDNIDSCCGTISGKLSNFDDEWREKYHVWAEEEDTGKIFAGVNTDKEGNYLIEGIKKTQYTVYAQDLKDQFKTLKLGNVDLLSDKNTNLDSNFTPEENSIDVDYLGLNGHLSTIAVPIVNGKSYRLYFAGQKIKDKDFNIEFSSDKFKVQKNSITKHNFGNALSVFSIEVFVEDNISVGDYSFYFNWKNGDLYHFVGGVTVENLEDY